MTKPSILFEDNHVIAVAKRPGYLATADRSEKLSEEQSLRAYLAQAKGVPEEKVFLKPVHQLDLPVSGCLIFAKSSKAAQRLSQSFQEKKVEKIYLLLSQQRIPLKNETLWSDFVAWDEKSHRAKVVGAGVLDAKKAELKISFRESFGSNIFLYEVLLITGRKHQIRAQTSSRKLFILGDHHYQHTDNLLQKNSIALHCSRMRLPHPTKGVLEVEAAMPDDWLRLRHPSMSKIHQTRGGR